ncbi:MULTISPECIES: acyl carrier protein [Burkholderia]|uniref:Phosphopantetheine attachment protein n=1 Tax=Burkholderia savannae TaxID=1637837 RepID=A0ABR5T3B6_9BURK|nr:MULTISPECIES: acyl carrier protein [Burkholderia]AOJ73047.1 phosphopantetheine attachment protein [Burkholderia savannae]AOJ84421.1 phosphopantetheine attachment protein [Burkholderia savannae]AOK49353.1 phosphopantetheine attachment protein [Burkholderia sp. MSMB617WGS]KGS02191.1 phosphopantetheine attachment site family protein [Burkholderia sp. ABCPW 111]KVG46977.1 phosphopantetheine attachment protein [Burkholderia sp. MSMB0265]
MKTETMLIQILESVIGVKKVTGDTRFLDIGGNSLNLVEVLKQIKAKTGVAPSPRLFFDKTRSTVAALSGEIDALRELSGAEAPVAG